MSVTPDVGARIERLYREEHGRIIAPLIRLLGDFARAEEVVQDAFEAALAQWPEEGVPAEPRAWILRAARNKAIDRIRRSARYRDKQAELTAVAAVEGAFAPSPDALLKDALRDDLLRLVFTCCHPALAPDAQIALTLRTVCGLTTEEIARAFLLDPRTMAQRIVRVQKKIAAAKIPYRVPEADELGARLEAVLHTLYLVFNEGYAASAGDALVRHELCAEGLRLAELVAQLLPDETEPKGLLALMLLTDARRDARVGPDGELVVLEEQDRTRWDHAAIARALPLVDASLAARPPRAYALQAAVAALHARAARAADTDWRQIAALYAIHARVAPSPVVELNHAVAVAMAGDLAEGLRRIEALDARGALARYHLLPAARADLLRRAGRFADARRAYDDALALATNEVERRYLARRREALPP
ncbi:MAG: RNA polymerase subunit sigma-24 [Sandaracinaceae bacterium]|nr:RNA polymerase subunit sigma-24 [Sandaracinaceae bacterium]